MRILFISDIHFGVDNYPDRLYSELNDVFFRHIEDNLNDIDLIVVGGDDTDTKISLNMNAAKYYLLFMNRLCSYIKRDGTALPVRLIYGTDSHQKNQLNSLSYLTINPMLNVRIFNTYAIEEICGNKILYLPEEQMYDKYQYYGDVLYNKNNKFDIVFGHGLFSFIADAYGDIEEENLKNTPIFTYEDFENIVSGPILFGHVHIHNNYKNKIYYSGSFSRFCFGEELPKGFLDITIDDKTKKYNVDFVENYLAPQFITLRLTKREMDMQTDNLIKYIIEYKNKNNIDKLRIQYNIVEMDGSKSKILENYFRFNKDMNIVVDIKRELNNIKNEINEKSLLYIFNEKIKIGDFYGNTINFAKERYNYEFSKEMIAELLNEAKTLK